MQKKSKEELLRELELLEAEVSSLDCKQKAIKVL
jgi:hypothetical protein